MYDTVYKNLARWIKIDSDKIVAFSLWLKADCLWGFGHQQVTFPEYRHKKADPFEPFLVDEELSQAVKSSSEATATPRWILL